MPIKNRKAIRAISAVVIFVIVFCILTFGRISTSNESEILESTLEPTSTEHSENEKGENNTPDTPDTSDDTFSASADLNELNDNETNNTVYPVDTENDDVYSYDAEIEAAHAKYRQCVGFDNSEEFDEWAMKAVKSSVLTNYKGKYSSCSTYKMYSTLKTDIERLIFHSFEYAFDNSYSFIFFDKDLVGDGIDIEKIFDCFMLDSPVTEQNNNCSVSGTAGNYMHVTYTYKDGGVEILTSSDGYLFWVDNFRTLNHDHYTEAYEKACRIVANMPGGLSKMEKAKYLYKYLCSHTVYDHTDSARSDELYNALVRGRCVCDGFSNAFSLLCNLAGIPCFEKMYSPEPPDVGHTWDCFCIDGVWYNADPTRDENLDESNPFEAAICGFGFSDKFQSHTPLYTDIIPQCTADTAFAGIKYVAKTDTENVLDAVIRSWLDKNKTIGFVLTDSMSDEEFDNGLRNTMRSYDGMPAEINKYYFWRCGFPGFDVLCFMNSET